MEKSASSLRLYRVAFWSAVAISVGAWLLPFGSLVVYPFSLLSTWAHEMGHGLAALAAGGRFLQLELHPQLSGVATTAVAGTGARALVAAGGLLGAPLLGVLTVGLVSGARRARVVLFALAALLLLSVLIWVRSAFGLVALPLLSAALGLSAWRLSERWRFVLAQLVAIQLSLSGLRGVGYLFSSSAHLGQGDVMPSDVAAIAGLLGGPHWLWGALILALELGLLYLAYRLVQRRLRRAAG